jgi:hypothetical protein
VFHLLKHGASKNIKNNRQLTPLQMAKDTEIREMLESNTVETPH